MSQAPQDGSIFDTLQSLIVAFVLAMAFRGFVAEGFVIPTGSMAPTLMGRHLRVQSPITGTEFPVGITSGTRPPAPYDLVDPMLGPHYEGTGSAHEAINGQRMGDRILVLKTLYPFFAPQRFDVVVFKNPTNPQGSNGNYIKRLIGLPDEAVWLVDGDVFTTPAGQAGDHASFRVQRKPDHVQRAVWQPVFSSDRTPADPARLDFHYFGVPFIGWTGDADDRRRMTWSDGAEPCVLQWDSHLRMLDDWTSYNQPSPQQVRKVSDLRVAGTIEPGGAGLVSQLDLVCRDHRFESVVDLARGEARIRMRWEIDENRWTGEASAPIAIPAPGAVTRIEYWHADQAVAIYVNGERVVELLYEWTPIERMERAFSVYDGTLERLEQGRPTGPTVQWTISGAPFALRGVSLDRDLYYRRSQLKPGDQPNEPWLTGAAFATSHDRLGVLGPDHFMMLGDNSQASLDSRLWGNPHELIVSQIDDAPFVVHRRLLLGKAWVVYFPSPLPYREGGKNVLPDFGRLRFIR